MKSRKAGNKVNNLESEVNVLVNEVNKRTQLRENNIFQKSGKINLILISFMLKLKIWNYET